jgi:protein tyrosine/serine phosphatase
MQEKCEHIIQQGIRCVINLMEEDEKNWSGKSFSVYDSTLLKIASRNKVALTVQRYPIKDRSIPSRTKMLEILDAVDIALDHNKPVYVHCWGGKGRTGTVIGCYLARHGYASGDEILKKISELRKSDPTWNDPSPENDLQCDFVRSWQQGE